MTPLGSERSDGLQNLTESVIAVQLIRAGIFVVMHNRVYPVHRVRKDPSEDLLSLPISFRHPIG
jgi:L-asparaginase/Glu-tRNA(Gln) amidotransferase subunit D